MLEVTIYSVLVESIVERLKALGLTGVSEWLSLGVGVVLAVAANVQLVPVDIVDNELVNQVVSGVVLSGGSNLTNSLRDKLKK